MLGEDSVGEDIIGVDGVVGSSVKFASCSGGGTVRVEEVGVVEGVVVEEGRGVEGFEGVEEDGVDVGGGRVVVIMDSHVKDGTDVLE